MTQNCSPTISVILSTLYRYGLGPFVEITPYVDVFEDAGENGEDTFMFHLKPTFGGESEKIDLHDMMTEGNSLFLALREIFSGFYAAVPFSDEKGTESEADRESRRLEAMIEKLQAKLGNELFLGKAPSHVVEAEKKKLSDFSVKRYAINLLLRKLRHGKRLHESIGRAAGEIPGFYEREKLLWSIQYLREQKVSCDAYSPEWFSEVYEKEIFQEEIEELYAFFIKEIFILLG